MYNDIDVYPYRRAGDGQRGAGPKAGKGVDNKRLDLSRIPWSAMGQVFTGRWLLLYLTAFFLGRAVLLGELMPFGVALIAALAQTTGVTNLMVLLFVGLGLVTVTNGMMLLSGLLVMLFTYLLLRFVPKLLQHRWYIVPGVVLCTELIIKCAFVAYQSGLLYGYVSVLFEAIFACVLTIAFIQALPPLWQQTVPGRISGEAVFCMLLLFGGVIAGTGEIGLDSVSLRGVVSNFVIMLAALVGGVGLGAAAGAVVGVIPGLSYVVAPVIIGAYSFAGLIAGMLRGFGRIGVVIGYLVGNILLSIYITNFGSMVQVLLEAALATLLFCFMPSRWVDIISKILPASPGIKLQPPALSQTRIKEITALRIRDWAQVFTELSNSFKQVSSSVEIAQEEQGLEKLFEAVGQKVCTGCALYRTCWEREFYRTYQLVLDLLANVEDNGRLTIDDLPDKIKKRCARLKEMTITINCLYENLKLDNFWQQKLLLSRQLVAEQLKGVAEILVDMSTGLEKNVESAGELEEALLKRLKKQGVDVEEIFVFYHQDGGLEVGLTRTACGGKLECQQKIVPLVSSTTGQNLVLADNSCTLKSEQRKCTFTMYSALPYRLTVGSAGMAQGNISGDSYITVPLRDGKYCLMLSDGMGVGADAQRESAAVVNLLEKLLKTGFDKDMAVKTVNSILVLRSPKDTFATVDLAVVDLYTGKTDFIKTCAEPCFIIKSGTVAVVKDHSLPVGVFEHIEVASQTRTLEAGDTLVMLSDGILESCQQTIDREEWFINILKDLADLPPQEMAEIILQVAETSAQSRGRKSDDMTVLVAQLEPVQF